MTNHVHLLMTLNGSEAISATLQAVGRRFVPYINHSYGRTGTLWEGRFKASAVQEEDYLIACYRYIELNPVRAGMVERPEDYPWSSYRANALGARDRLITPHPVYLTCGTDAPGRQAAYRQLFATHLDADLLRNVRTCLQTGTPLGNDRFGAQLEQALGIRVGYSTRGRLKKPPGGPGSDDDQLVIDL
ncbi:MAG: transposase [Gammaproteobacteria bacterium]